MKRLPMRRARLPAVLCLAALLWAGATPPQAGAQTVTLASLLAGGTIVNGPLTFQNFTGFVATASGPNATPVAANQIFVTPFQDLSNPAKPIFGLTFSSAAMVAGPSSTQDTLFQYDVVASGGQLIFHNGLSIDGFGTTGNAVILIGESRRDENGLPVLDTSVPPRTSKLVSSNPALAGLEDTATFQTPQNFLTISKDVALIGGTGTAFLSDFQQTYSIPEPGSLALVGLGAVGLAGYAWRRRKLAAP